MGVDTTAEGVSAAQSQADQISTPSQYPTATRIEDGFAYDKSGAKLGAIDEGSLQQPSAPPSQAAPKPQSQNISGDDPAESILRGAQGLDNNARRDAWDAFTNSHDEDELTNKLQSMNLPQSVKAALWNAKYQASQKALSAARQQEATTDKPGFAQRLRESVQLPGSSQDLQQAAQQEQDKTLKDHLAEAARQTSYGPLVDTVEGLYGYGKRIHDSFQDLRKESIDAANNVWDGGSVGQNIGKLTSAFVNTGVGAIPFIGEPIVKAGEDIASGPESGMEPGTFHFKGGNYAGAAGSLTGVVAQLLAGELIHKGEAHLVRANDAQALEVANKTHTTNRAVYDTRVTDNVTAGNQARDAAVKAAEASEDYANGKISEAAKDEAHTNSNSAAANARKASQALQDATAARNQSAVDEAKALRKLQDNVKRTPDKKAVEAAAKAEEQHATDIEDAMPSAPKGPAKYSDEDRATGSKYLRNYQDTVKPVNSVQDTYNAYDNIQQNMEGRVKPFVEKYRDDLLPNDVRMGVHDALADSPRQDFAEKGMAALTNYGDLSHLTIGEADDLRSQLIKENRSVLDNKTNTHDISTLLDTNPEFAARYHLADSLRDGVYDYLEDRGVQGIREIRQDESSIIRMKNAAEKALPKGDSQVRGSAKSSWKRKAAAWSTQKALTVGGAKVFGPKGAVFGSIAGEHLGELIHPDDPTRDALVQRAMSVKAQAPQITPSISGVGAPPNALPGLLIPELTKVMRENTPLHSDLATHYGESVYDTSYGDLEDKFMKDIADKRRFGVPLESDEKSLLGKINAQGAAEALKAYQASQEAQVQGKPPVPTATLPDQVEQLMPIKGKMPNGMSTQEGLIHDLAHIVVGTEKGIPFEDGIRSHLHPENAGQGKLLTAPINFTDFVDENGNLDLKKLKPRIADLTTTYVAGGVANDLWHGIPFTENHGLGADMTELKKFMKKAGFSEVEASKLIAQSADDAAQILSRPGTKEILEQHAAVREGGLDPEHHFSQERVEQILQDIKGDTNGEASKKSARGSGEGERPVGQAGPGGKAEAEGRNAKGVPAEGEGTPKGKAGRTEEEPEPVGSPALRVKPQNPALSQEERDIGKLEPFSFGYMRPDGSIEQGSRFGNPDVMVHDDLARTKGDKMNEVLSTPGGVKYGTGKNRGFISIENGDPKTVSNAIKVAESLPNEEIDFDFAKPGQKPVAFEGSAKQLAGKLRRYFAEPEQYDLGDIGNPALSEGKTTGVKEHDDAIRAAGAVPGGYIKGNPESGFDNHALYHDPTTGNTLATPFGKLNRDEVARKLQESRAEFAAKETPFGNPNREKQTPFANPNETGKIPPKDLSRAIPTNAQQELAAVEPELAKREERKVERQRDLNRAFAQSDFAKKEGIGIDSEDVKPGNPALAADKSKGEYFDIAGANVKHRAEFNEAVRNTPGASLGPDGLTVDLVRHQKPEQAGQSSVRGGVFFTPEEKSPYQRHYVRKNQVDLPNGGSRAVAYGGSQRIEGSDTLKNPLIVKGSTGGKVPERAYNHILGDKNAYQTMSREVNDAIGFRLSDVDKEERIADLLEQHGGNRDLAWNIVQNSKDSNQLPYAVREHIVGAELRKHGYDAIVGYSKAKGAQRLSEVFHLGMENYPTGDEGDMKPPSWKQPPQVPQYPGQALSPEDARATVAKIRAGDARSKNGGAPVPEPPTGSLKQVDLPTSSFSASHIEHLRESTDPSRVADYVNSKPQEPIYAVPGKRGANVGKYVINDGGHRLLAAIDRGDSSIKALVPADKDLNPAAPEQYETVHRGEGPTSQKDGNFWSPDREWARQFTHSGQDHEIKTGRIKMSDIYEPDSLPYGGDPDQMDAAIKEAKAKGFKAVRVDEGKNEPKSVYTFDKDARPEGSQRRAGIGGYSGKEPTESHFAEAARKGPSDDKEWWEPADMGNGGKAWLDTDGKYTPQDKEHQDIAKNFWNNNVRIGNLEGDGPLLVHAEGPLNEQQRQSVAADIKKQGGAIYDLKSGGNNITGEAKTVGDFLRKHDEVYKNEVKPGNPALSERSEDDKQAALDHYDKQYPTVAKGQKVDGREVRDKIPNTDSIDASLGVHPGAYETLPGVREIPMSEFGDIKDSEKNPRDAHTRNLAEQIKDSKSLNPLIVAVDKDGPYILEGGHRFDALRSMGAKSFPAKVAVDLTDEGAKAPEKPSTAPVGLHDLGKDHNIPSDAGYVYHATNAERAHDIANDGSLNVHKPDYGTDQDVWPDGSKDKRSYFTSKADQAWQFAPEDGKSALLRMKRDPNVHQVESTGDLFSKKKIGADKLEYLGSDKQWRPLSDLKSEDTNQAGLDAFEDERNPERTKHQQSLADRDTFGGRALGAGNKKIKVDPEVAKRVGRTAGLDALKE